MEIKVNALMLRATPYGENDKILTLLTAERGKISASVKGVKKAGAKLKFAAQPFCFAEYMLAQKGDRYTVIGCSEIESFYGLREDILRFYAASAVCEAANAVAFENEECPELFTETIKALSAICGEKSEAVNGVLIKYLTYLLSEAGYAISADICPHCKKSLIGEDKLLFDMSLGAFCCKDCGEGEGASRVTYNVFRKLFNKSYEEDFITPDGEKRALRLLREYFRFKTDTPVPALSEYIRLQ